MVKISIIIPAYNIEKYIQKAIKSVMEQSLKEIEIIVINDGSIDRTKEKIEELIKYDKRIKLINLSNGGVSRARNIGINIANGEYVLFLDGDDWISKNCLKELYETSKRDNLDLLVFNYTKVFSNEMKEYKCNVKDEIISGKQALKEVLVDKITPSIWNKFISRKILSQNMRFEEDIAIGEDLLLSIKICSIADRVGKINKSYYYYYMREDSVTHKVTEKIFSIKNSIDRIEEYLKKEDLFKDNIEEIMFLKFMHLYFYRVIVGDIDDNIHRYFFYKYKQLNNIKNNKYYEEFKSKSKFDVRIRLLLYKCNYNIARKIHKTILKIIR